MVYIGFKSICKSPASLRRHLLHCGDTCCNAETNTCFNAEINTCFSAETNTQRKYTCFTAANMVRDVVTSVSHRSPLFSLSAQFGPVRIEIWLVRSGSVRIGLVRSGSVRIGLLRIEPTWTSSVRSGSVRTGPYYVLHTHTTYSSNVDMDIPCYRTTGTYPCIILLLDYIYKVLDGVEWPTAITRVSL